jgi:hypothetical protein
VSSPEDNGAMPSLAGSGGYLDLFQILSVSHLCVETGYLFYLRSSSSLGIMKIFLVLFKKDYSWRFVYNSSSYLTP